MAGIHHRLSIAYICAAAAVLCALVGAVPASAQNSLSTTGTPDYANGLVPVRVFADSTVESVTITCIRASEPAEVLSGVEESPGVFVAWVRPKAESTVHATAFEAGGVVWTSAPVTLRASSYAPAAPALVLTPGALVGPTHAFTGQVGSTATAVHIRVKRGPIWVHVWSGAVTRDAAGAVSLPPVELPHGANSVSLVAENGFGMVAGPAVTVYNLGTTPALAKYVLVDKSDRRLYEVHSGVVTFTTRCAIGLPWAPTPTGTFKLGKRKKGPNAVWGPWRTPLLRKVKKTGKYRATAYYIHGTNRPGAIGTMVSHGCVRVLNKEIRVLSKRLKGYTLVIRP